MSNGGNGEGRSARGSVFVCLFVCMTGHVRFLSSTVHSRPHLKHLLDVILVLGIYDAIHVPLEDFDQVPGEHRKHRALAPATRRNLTFPLEFWKNCY